ncbi:hypothetical protein ACOSQ2_031920 [Xanthoceras sorbifolium]
MFLCAHSKANITKTNDRLHKKRRRVTLRVPSSKRDRRKTEISTFVNFIHQRDAHIAMSVVEYMLLFGAPIYTVHDNFITTAQYSVEIPKIYSKVIRDMGPPLSIINEFIYMNVIQPIAKWESNGPTEGDFASRVINNKMLHYYLMANVPENISKKMRATWEERISGILTSYNNYTRNVCGKHHQNQPRNVKVTIVKIITLQSQRVQGIETKTNSQDFSCGDKKDDKKQCK